MLQACVWVMRRECGLGLEGRCQVPLTEESGLLVAAAVRLHSGVTSPRKGVLGSKAWCTQSHLPLPLSRTRSLVLGHPAALQTPYSLNGGLSMADQYNTNEEKILRDSNTKEIDLINRDPKQINEDVVKVCRHELHRLAWTFPRL